MNNAEDAEDCINDHWYSQRFCHGLAKTSLKNPKLKIHKHNTSNICTHSAEARIPVARMRVLRFDCVCVCVICPGVVMSHGGESILSSCLQSHALAIVMEM